MKKVVLLIFLGLMTFSLSAQEADAHIASLVNNEEWFALAEDLPLYSDSGTFHWDVSDPKLLLNVSDAIEGMSELSITTLNIIKHEH